MRYTFYDFMNWHSGWAAREEIDVSQFRHTYALLVDSEIIVDDSDPNKVVKFVVGGVEYKPVEDKSEILRQHFDSHTQNMKDVYGDD